MIRSYPCWYTDTLQVRSGNSNWITIPSWRKEIGNFYHASENLKCVTNRKELS